MRVVGTNLHAVIPRVALLLLVAVGCAGAQQGSPASAAVAVAGAEQGSPASTAVVVNGAEHAGPSVPPATPTPMESGGPSQPLPDAPSASLTPAAKPLRACDPYVPLSNNQKFTRWLHRTYSPYTFTSVLFGALQAQAFGNWPGYGGGMEGFGNRLGATFADTQTSLFFKAFFLPTVMHEDPRLFYSGKHGVGPRAWYAVTRVVVTRKDDGRSAFNTPETLGTLLGAAVNNAYYPNPDRGFNNTMRRTFNGITSDATSNLLHEFWPDISKMFRKHEPDRMKQMEMQMEKHIPQPIMKVTGPQPP